MSVTRIRLVTRQLLRQNRVLLLFLMLWPCILSGILLLAEHGAPPSEDVASILAQELFYGLVLVGLAASVALGTESKAHRTQLVLGRAVSRTEYLTALGVSAYLPFAGYLLVWVANAGVLATLLHAGVPMLPVTLIAGLAAGLLLGAVGLLCSVVLPQIAAAVGTGLVLAGLVAAGRNGWGSVAQVFGIVGGSVAPAFVPWIAVGETVGAAAVLVLAALALFSRKDLL